MSGLPASGRPETGRQQFDTDERFAADGAEFGMLIAGVGTDCLP